MAPKLDLDGYRTLVRELRAGGFGRPAEPDAWPAEFVAAHVALNNDYFTETARAVIAGGEPTYDNEPAVDTAELSAYVARVGDLTALADEVQRSADDLAAAYADLDDTQGATPVLVRIRDGGTLIVDEPRPIASMIAGNATFHLQIHLAQLLELRG